MVNQEILEGLKLALSRNESLQSAMQSFYNVGYGKQEIEEAARALQLEIFQRQYNQQPTQQNTITQKRISPQVIPQRKTEYKPLEAPPSTEQTQKPISIQKVSNYEREQRDIISIILIIILIVLLGTLVSVFIFKQKIVEFLNTLF